jgi:tetratricopeptide (TPR) repeat protein
LKQSGRRAAERRVFWLAAVALCAAAGCAEDRSSAGAIREAYAEGRYEEALSLCERSIRRGAADGEVFYISGMLLLAEGKVDAAEDRFREALRADSSLADEIAGALLERAEDSLDEGTVPRATLLARAAAGIDRSAPVGRLGYLVAASYYDERNWAEAAYWYEEAVGAYPDTGAAELALIHLAESRAAMGDSAGAIEALEMELERFPRGEVANRAGWVLSGLLYGRARAEFERGDYRAVLRTAQRAADVSRDDLTVQKAAFLIGETFERLGDFDRAYEQYEKIAAEGRGAPGGIAERAKAKMRGFREAGLR